MIQWLLSPQFLATGVPCLIAGVCAISFVAIWFSTAYRTLSEQRRNLNGLREQLRLHQAASAQAGDGPQREVAMKMLSTNQSIFRQAVDCYNQLLKKPGNRLPALLLGFRPADD